MDVFEALENSLRSRVKVAEGAKGLIYIPSNWNSWLLDTPSFREFVDRIKALFPGVEFYYFCSGEPWGDLLAFLEEVVRTEGYLDDRGKPRILGYSQALEERDFGPFLDYSLSGFSLVVVIGSHPFWGGNLMSKALVRGGWLLGVVYEGRRYSYDEGDLWGLIGQLLSRGLAFPSFFLSGSVRERRGCYRVSFRVFMAQREYYRRWKKKEKEALSRLLSGEFSLLISPKKKIQIPPAASGFSFSAWPGKLSHFNLSHDLELSPLSIEETGLLREEPLSPAPLPPDAATVAKLLALGRVRGEVEKDGARWLVAATWRKKKTVVVDQDDDGREVRTETHKPQVELVALQVEGPEPGLVEKAYL